MDDWSAILDYLASTNPQVCELDASPYLCEFWPLSEVERYNAEYQVPIYAVGFRAFGTNGGGEMFALSPSGQVVCLPFIGMEPSAAMELAPNWKAFRELLRAA